MFITPALQLCAFRLLGDQARAASANSIIFLIGGKFAYYWAVKSKHIWVAVGSIFLSVVSANESAAAPRYEFTTASASGTTGPTQAQINSAYSGTTLSGLVTINTQGIQEWTVPTTGDYTIEIAGASGGYTPGALGGKGRVIKIQVTLTAGNLFKILVGQEGGRHQFSVGYAGGGGGGTYIYNVTNSAFVAVAGGGGGAAQGNTQYVSTQPGVNAAAYNSTAGTAGTSYAGSYSGPGAGGTNGGAGTTSGAGSGAGISANGANGGYGGLGGTRFAAGGTGGANGKSGSVVATLNIPGGFGGGGGAGIYDPYEAIGGGGGGYSGGGSGATRIGAGGGGGNFYTGTYISNGLNTGDGYASIQLVAAPTVTLATAGNVTTAVKGINLTLTATLDETVKITFYADGKRIPGCINLDGSAGTKSCNWKPPVQKNVTIYATISQSGSIVARSANLLISVKKRSGSR